MDMNQLFYHHQLALMAADRALRDTTAIANFDLPRHYAKRIEEYRACRGMPAYFTATRAEATRRRYLPGFGALPTLPHSTAPGFSRRA